MDNKIEEAIEIIDKWLLVQPYPKSVFPAVPKRQLKEIHDMLKENFVSQ